MIPAEQDRSVDHVAALRHRIDELSKAYARERERRLKAEQNACRFHAFLLEERIKHLPERAA